MPPIVVGLFPTEEPLPNLCSIRNPPPLLRLCGTTPKQSLPGPDLDAALEAPEPVTSGITHPVFRMRHNTGDKNPHCY